VNENDPFASVRAPVIERAPVQAENDPFASVRAPTKKIDNKEFETLLEPALLKYGKAALRGIGNTLSNLIEANALHEETASLPALLGMKTNVTPQRNLSQSIQENIPEESPQVGPAMFSKGVEYATNPLSLFGGPGSAFIAGAAGKGLEKAGAPKWLQIAGELSTTLLKGGPKKVYAEGSPEIRAAEKIMKQRGLSEEEIVLAKNAMKEKRTLENMAKMYKSTEKQFESTKKSIENGVNEIISESFPGFNKGIEEVEKRATELFKPIRAEAKQVVVMKPEKFTKKIDDIVNDIRDNLANTPDEESFIKMLETAKNKAVEGRSADNYVSFYQTLNRIGKWVDPSKKESYMREAKDAIKQTFRENGPAGQKLANNFEKANEGWIKYHQAEKVNKILENSYVNESIDFKKLHQSISKDKNYSIFKDAIGDEAAANLKLMTKIGEGIQRSEKAIEGSALKQGITIGKGVGIVTGLMSLNPTTIATTAKGAIGIAFARYISTQLLTNPKYQNLWIRMAGQVKKGNITQAIILSEEIMEKSKKEFESIQ
jgi:hypothetical protein